MKKLKWLIIGSLVFIFALGIATLLTNESENEKSEYEKFARETVVQNFPNAAKIVSYRAHLESDGPPTYCFDVTDSSYKTVQVVVERDGSITQKAK